MRGAPARERRGPLSQRPGPGAAARGGAVVCAGAKQVARERNLCRDAGADPFSPLRTPFGPPHPRRSLSLSLSRARTRRPGGARAPEWRVWELPIEHCDHAARHPAAADGEDPRD